MATFTKSNNYLVLDLGTTNVKAFVFDGGKKIIARAYMPVAKIVRGPVVEQYPMELLRASKKVLRQAVLKSGKKKFAALGITTQRETTIAWDSDTGKPFFNAIVWEDRRTAGFCRKIKAKDKAAVLRKTGLPPDPYFSAPKMVWLLQNIAAVRTAADFGNLRFGTPESWLLWNFLQGSPHLTDYTNASRTLLFNLKTLAWDKQLLSLFGVPADALPKPCPSIFSWGVLKKELLGFEIPVWAVCGDQQASLYAAGKSSGTTKVTFGTGAFIMQVMGRRFKLVPGFFTTLCAGKSLQKLYACEAKINLGAKQVKPLLGKPKELKKLISSLTKQASAILLRLPKKPGQVIIDGGVAQYKDIAALQAKSSGLKIIKQSTHEGTALGVAKMLIDAHVRL